MHRRASRTSVIACGAIAVLGVVVAAARSAARRRGTSVGAMLSARASTLRAEWTIRTRKPSPARQRGSGDRVEPVSRRKQDFLGLLSHELRNPLSAIHAALAVMRARESEHVGQRARTVIERQVSHIARLVEDLVDTARIERGTLSLQIEPVDVREVLRTAVEMAQPSVAHRSQTLEWQESGEPLLVNGDRVRLQQVFSNLLLNATKYTPEHGQIELITYRAGSDFCVAVRDSGKGIAAEDLPRVFEPFVRATRDEPGLGVGLYVARTLIEQHGGEITVESGGVHQGATFTVRLPELSPLLQRLAGSGPHQGAV
jgi:signal transduction histidine kinase